MSLPYEIVCGLEVHVELSTATKMFCRCINDPFHAEEPNLHVCPVCLGLPGALPVPNEEAMRRVILLGKALGGITPELARFDRKHYTYPDLPKGYQITQMHAPFVKGGVIELLDAQGEVESTVRVHHIHLEEDAGKLQHRGGKSLVDLNRAGVPLVEMVLEPDCASAAQAKRVFQEMQQLVRHLGIATADMEKGEMRADVNISIRFTHDGEVVWTPVTEVKNVNSSRAVERAIETEAQRLYDEWMAGGNVRTRKAKITVGWDEDSQSVNMQRAKEGAADYRYLPEPDLPPVRTDGALSAADMVLPELPNAFRRRFLKDGVESKLVELFLGDPELRGSLERFVTGGVAANEAAKWLANVPGTAALPTETLTGLVTHTAAGTVSFSAVKPFVPELAALQGDLDGWLREKQLLLEHDSAAVDAAIAQVFAANPDAVTAAKNGEVRLMGFLVGQVLKQVGKAGIPAKVQDQVQGALKA